MENLILRAEAPLTKSDIIQITDNVEEAIRIYIEDCFGMDMSILTRSSKELLLKAIFDKLLGNEED